MKIFVLDGDKVRMCCGMKRLMFYM